MMQNNPLVKSRNDGPGRCYRGIATSFTNQLEAGYTLAGALVLLAVMAIFMALAAQSWSFIKQRENEEELIFRGKEYMEAIGRYHAKFNSFPPDIDTLLKQKFLRREYKDPMTRSGKWKVLRPDSLVQTGEAGQITQPGQLDKLGEQPQSTDDRNSPRKEKPSTTRTSATPSEQTEADDKSDEEPETEVVGPIVGVVSRSKKTSIRVYNQQNTYNKWYFVYAVPQQPQKQRPPQQQTPQKGPRKKTPPPKTPPAPQKQN